MKFKALKTQFFLTFLSLSLIGVASNAIAINPNDLKITIDIEDLALKAAKDKIESITSFKFFYKTEDLNLKRKKTIKVKNASINYILTDLLKEEELGFKVMKNQIILKKRADLKKEIKQNHNNDFEILGKVFDKVTGDIIPYCSLLIKNSYTGTSTNEEGEFILNVDELPVELVFQHLGYETQTIIVSQTTNVEVKLIPRINELEEVLISTTTNKRALKLAKSAFKRTKNTLRVAKFGKALYRQKSKNNDDYSELVEIIYDIRYSNSGIEDWDILQGRYALKEESVNNKNYTLLSRLFRSIQPDTDDLIFPLHSELETFYNVRIINKIQSEGGEIAVLWFKPLKNISIPIFEGEVYIDTKTFDVLKVTGSISRDDLKLIKLTEEDTYKKNYELLYEINFKKDSVLGLAIDYIKVNHEFDYYKGDRLQTRVSSMSNLSFFEYYTPASRKKLGKQFKRGESDWEKLNEIGYDKNFWEDNPIVKRTPVEEEVIASFEKDNAFESIFINRTGQVTSLQTSIAGDPFIKSLSTDLQLYNTNNPVEKVSLHTDKDIVSPGEDLWYSAYCVLGTGYNYSLASKVLYVDLINSNNEVILSQTQELIEGRGAGSMRVPEGLVSGTYLLRAYTNWMRNYDSDFFFTKRIYIIDKNGVSTEALTEVEEKIDLQFFPEGGDCIIGLSGLIAFKAIGADGLSRVVKGNILNSKGDFIAPINTLDKGAGFFTHTPILGERYEVELEDGSRYSLPEAKAEGYSLLVNNTSSRSIIVKVKASDQLRAKRFYVIGSIQNEKYYQGRFEFAETDVVNFEIPKSKLPSGVMTLTLFDEEGKPRSERIVFINNKEELVINTKINKNRLGTRDKIQIEIDVRNTNGDPIRTDLSVSITDGGRVKKSVNSNNILTHLLLESDIKGEIEEPGSYFRDQQRSTTSKLDLVMLTHGWRRFNWKDKQDSLSDKFTFSTGLSITGTARYSDNRLLKNRDLRVISKSDNALKMYPIRTDNLGRFSVDSLNHSKSTEFVFNAYSPKGAPIDLKIVLDEKEEEDARSELTLKNYTIVDNFKEIKDKEERIAYVNATSLRRETDSLYDLSKVTILDQVFLEGQGTKKEANTAPSVYNLTPDSAVYTKDFNGSPAQGVTALLSTVSGVTVNGEMVYIRGSQFASFNSDTGPLWVFDGVPIVGGADVNGQSSNIPEIIRGLTFFDIERVEVLKSGRAASYGSRGANGVILVYTKRGSYVNSGTTSPSFTLNGYSGSKEFYSPKYDVKLEKHKKPDYRITLYWNPSLTTNKNGRASLVFYNTDITKNIQVDVQGLSEYGIPGAYLKAFGKNK